MAAKTGTISDGVTCRDALHIIVVKEIERKCHYRHQADKHQLQPAVGDYGFMNIRDSQMFRPMIEMRDGQWICMEYCLIVV